MEVQINITNVVNDLAAQLGTALRDLAVAREQIKSMEAVLETQNQGKERQKPLRPEKDEPPF